MAQHSQEGGPPSEQSPLLGDRSQAVNGHVTDAEQQPSNTEQDGADEVALAEEASNQKLVVILFTLFIGVFFAALGRPFPNQPRLTEPSSLTATQTQPSSPR